MYVCTDNILGGCIIYIVNFIITTPNIFRLITAWRVSIARTMPPQDVCQFVYLSVYHTPVLCLNGYTYPQIFSPSGSRTILVFKRLTLL